MKTDVKLDVIGMGVETTSRFGDIRAMCREGSEEGEVSKRVTKR